jgi:hypothetical protein
MNWLTIRSLAERNIVIEDDQRVGVCRIGTTVTVSPDDVLEEARKHGMEIVQEGWDVLAIVRT